MTVYAPLLAAWSAAPDAPGLRFGDRRIPKGELLQSVLSTAAQLRESRVLPGDRVALLAENGPETLYLYYGCAVLGAVFVPMNANVTAPEVDHIVRHSRPKLLFFDKRMEATACATAAPVEKRLLGSDLPFGSPVHDIGHGRDEDDFLIIYTSGSTGTPKAVVFDQDAEFRGNEALIDMWGLTPADVTVVALPMGFLYGLSTAAATSLQAGGEVVILPRFHPRDVLEAFIETDATVFQGVPTMFSMMLDYAEQNGRTFDLSGMRLLISAGAPLSDELRQRFRERFNKSIDDYYALTEVRPVFGRFAADITGIPRGSLGKAAPGVIVSIVDGQGRPVEDSTVGEVLIRAASTFNRYLDDDDLTRSAFSDGLFRTGDLGYRDTDGFYFLTGRIKDIIIRGGANIAPAEVEGVLGQHPSVASAAVIGVPDATFGEVPVAYVAARPGHQVSPEALMQHCTAVLASFKVPMTIVPVDELPLGKTGKVDKAALLELWRAHSES